MAVFNGIAYQYAWPQSPLLGSALQSAFLMSALLFLVLFSRSLLRVPLHSPRLDWANRLLLALIGALLVLAPFHDYAVLVRPISLAVLWAMAMVLAMGFTAWRAGEPTARYYLFAWSAFVAGVVAYMLKSFGLLPHGFLTQYGFQIGTVFEFILLSVALGIRVQQLRQQSRTDALTGLANRSRFDELIEAAFAQHGATAPLALLVIDVDHFKRVNDEYGHAVGDRVLQRVADSLRKAMQGPQEACRYGGEEFAILLPRTDLARACAVAEALRAAIIDDRREPAVSISIGVACTAGARFADPRALFRAADEALYAAKRGGRNRVVSAVPPAANGVAAAAG
jgi:diguanylate cyclase (GGDEF)-like protein